MNILLIVLLILLLVGAFHFSPTIGNYPVSGIGTVLIVVLVLVLFGRI